VLLGVIVGVIGRELALSTFVSDLGVELPFDLTVVTNE